MVQFKIIFIAGYFSSNSGGKAKRRWSMASLQLLAKTNLGSHTDGPEMSSWTRDVIETSEEDGELIWMP